MEVMSFFFFKTFANLRNFLLFIVSFSLLVSCPFFFFGLFFGTKPFGYFVGQFCTVAITLSAEMQVQVHYLRKGGSQTHLTD